MIINWVSIRSIRIRIFLLKIRKLKASSCAELVFLPSRKALNAIKITIFFHMLFDMFVINIYIINIYISRHIPSQWLSNRFWWCNFRWDCDFIPQMRSCVILLTVTRVGWNEPGSVTETGRLQFSNQWPELFKSDRVPTWETVSVFN